MIRTSAERNEAIEKIDAMFDNTRPIHYFGWYWREVDFDQPITLAIDHSGRVAFCENNKWDYPTITITAEQQKELIEAIDIALDSANLYHLIAVNTLMKQIWLETKTDQL